MNEATVHLTQVVDGKVTKCHLCTSCAEARGLDVETGDVDINHMLEALKKSLSPPKKPFPSAEAAERMRCPSCGMPRAELEKKGRVGCAHCYEFFATWVLPMVMAYQHGDQHTGKVPKRASSQLRTSVELGRLRRELEKAVAGERYEEAAGIRDRIHALLSAEDRP
ncbi:MAG: UvrB/UvrC motif-containing protein [Verrucomicrobiota bacterium]|nr:UvrB/UvrC motif-containing protein [Verrucomicrobiota bacterium]